MDALYQKQILDYAQKSKKYPSLEKPSHVATFYNPTCGDHVNISLLVAEQLVDKIGVQVRGCALCEAGAGLLVDCFTGEAVKNIHVITENFEKWIDGSINCVPKPAMLHFTPIRNIRNRHKCVLLPFYATVKALEKI